MTDAVQIFPVGFRVTDTAGAPVSGAKIKFYQAGTSTLRTVYSNSGLSSSLGSTVYTGSDGFPVASSGSSTEVSVYTGTTAYKVIIYTSADVEIITLDNLLGALDTSTFLTTGSTSTLSIPVISKTANYTVVAADRGKLIQGNASGGNFTLTLTAAATLTDGWNAEFRNSGTSGQVMLAASEAISFEGQTFTTRALEIGEAMVIRCDGTAFKVVSHTPPLMASRGPGVILITDRVTSDPGSPTPGARYIVSTGYGSYATGDIIEANNVSFNKYTPAANCGWIAYVLDEKVNYQFKASTWVRLGISIQTFTASGTYTPTTGMAMCKVTSTGGGGGGGAADANDGSSNASGGGGGAGGTCVETFTASDIGASQTVTIGAGGAGGVASTGATGTTGGNTTFGALHTATGGAGGVGVQTTSSGIGTGGAGGIPTNGTINIDGGDGGSGSVTITEGNDISVGGLGGSSFWGGGGKGGMSTGSAQSTAGTAARAYGAGGGGAGAADSAEAAGGAGKDGIVVVEEYF